MYLMHVRSGYNVTSTTHLTDLRPNKSPECVCKLFYSPEVGGKSEQVAQSANQAVD